ncbi:MAG: response regulator [Spirochaetia bacterium]|nr:response regulator [Spirochaetia bacterium]
METTNVPGQKLTFNNRIIHQINRPIMIVEDTESARVLIEKVCQNMGLDFVSTSNGQEAMEYIDNGEQFSIFIVDLNMPVMDGKSLIQNLKMVEPDSVILVETAMDDPKSIIQLMKMGVYDYVIKPLDITLMEQTILNALEYKHLKNTEKQMKLHSAEKLRKQLEWLTYKDSRKKMDKDGEGSKTIYNLKTSLAQGGGFGTMITLIDLMRMNAHSEGGKYTFESEIVDLLFENAEVARQAISGLDKIDKIIADKFVKDSIKGSTIINDIPTLLKDVIPYGKSRNISISFPALRQNCSVGISRTHFYSAVKELVINAVKYAKPNTIVSVFTQISDGYFVIGVKNDVLDDPFGGIPEGYEKFVIEPFVRVHPPVEDGMTIEQFSLGLGLTAVEFITSKHNGVFFINNAKDHTGESVVQCVIAQMLIPIENMFDN